MVWDPVGEGNQHLRYQIEMVQRRAARFVTGDWRTTSSVTALIKTLQWQTQEERRRQSRLIFLRKYCHKAIDITEPIVVRGRGVNINYQAINPRLRCYDNSFTPSTDETGTCCLPISERRQMPRNSKRNCYNSQNKHTLNFAKMMYYYVHANIYFHLIRFDCNFIKYRRKSLLQYYYYTQDIATCNEHVNKVNQRTLVWKRRQTSNEYSIILLRLQS